MNLQELAARGRAARQAKGSYSKQNPLEKWNASDKSSRTLAIKAKCWECSHGQKEEIADCRVVTCPLHCIRPYQPKED